jgi:hypothetical protein
MREATTKCKVDVQLILLIMLHHHLYATSHLHFRVLAATLTRSRKLAAEDTFCCELKRNMSLISTQAKPGRRRMMGKNSQQKSFSR